MYHFIKVKLTNKSEGNGILGVVLKLKDDII